MEKKKKRPTAWLGHNWKTLLKIVGGLGLLSLFILGCLISVLYYFLSFEPWLNEIKALDKINQMQNWELPPDSEFVSFGTESRVGGTMHFVWGELTIASSLSLEEIQIFYWIRYPDFKVPRSPDKLDISIVDNAEMTTGRTVYMISAAEYFAAP